MEPTEQRIATRCARLAEVGRKAAVSFSNERREAMLINVTRRTALIGLSAFVALPVHAQPTPTQRDGPDAPEFAILHESAVFEVASIGGSLKETIQMGQELIWRRKEQPTDATFQLTNLSVALIRREFGGGLMMTFSCNITSLGYRTSDEAELHIIFRTQGGAALHTAVFGVSVKCTDKNQTLHPAEHEIPRDIAGQLFVNVRSVEVTEHSEPNSPGLKVQRCS